MTDRKLISNIVPTYNEEACAADFVCCSSLKLDSNPQNNFGAISVEEGPDV
jgi:hypothetical protein